MKTLACLLLTIAALGFTTPGRAQERETGSAGFTAYTDKNFRGKTVNIREDVPDLATLGLDNKISSFKIASGGQWEVFEGRNYQGRSQIVSANKPTLEGTAWDNKISSLRRAVSGEPTSAPAHAQPPQGDNLAILFDETDFSGKRLELKAPAAKLGNFDERAQSVTIEKGVWELCEEPAFGGRCVTLEHSASDLALYGLKGRVSSVRPAPSSQGRMPWMVLYDKPDYGGYPKYFNGALPDLGPYGDRAESVTVGEGVWVLCDGVDFTGKCITVSKNIPDLANLGMKNSIRSVKPVRAQPH